MELKRQLHAKRQVKNNIVVELAEKDGGFTQQASVYRSRGRPTVERVHTANLTENKSHHSSSKRQDESCFREQKSELGCPSYRSASHHEAEAVALQIKLCQRLRGNQWVEAAELLVDTGSPAREYADIGEFNLDPSVTNGAGQTSRSAASKIRISNNHQPAKTMIDKGMAQFTRSDLEQLASRKSNILYKQRPSNAMIKSLNSVQSFVNREIDYTLKNYVNAEQLATARGGQREKKPSIIESLLEGSIHGDLQQDMMETEHRETDSTVQHSIPQPMMHQAFQPPPASSRKPVLVDWVSSKSIQNSISIDHQLSNVSHAGQEHLTCGSDVSGKELLTSPDLPGYSIHVGTVDKIIEEESSNSQGESSPAPIRDRILQKISQNQRTATNYKLQKLLIQHKQDELRAVRADNYSQREQPETRPNNLPNEEPQTTGTARFRQMEKLSSRPKASIDSQGILKLLQSTETPGLGTMREYQRWQLQTFTPTHDSGAFESSSFAEIPKTNQRLYIKKQETKAPDRPKFKQLRVQTYSNKSLQRLDALRVHRGQQQPNHVKYHHTEVPRPDPVINGQILNLSGKRSTGLSPRAPASYSGNPIVLRAKVGCTNSIMRAYKPLSPVANKQRPNQLEARVKKEIGAVKQNHAAAPRTDTNNSQTSLLNDAHDDEEGREDVSSKLTAKQTPGVLAAQTFQCRVGSPSEPSVRYQNLLTWNKVPQSLFDLRKKSQEKQTKDFAPSTNKNNFFMSNQRFQRERDSISLASPKAALCFSETSLPVAQEKFKRYQQRSQHGTMKMTEISQMSNANFGTATRRQPAQTTGQPSMQFSTRYQGLGHSRPGELEFLTHSDKSLINEIQGYIQSKGLNRHHLGMRTALLSPTNRKGDGLDARSPMASWRQSQTLQYM